MVQLIILSILLLQLLKVIRDIDPTPFQVTNYKNTLALFDTLIGDNKYVTGDELTIADISFLATSTVLTINEFKDIDQLLNLKGWYERLKEELPYFNEVNEDANNLFRTMVENKQIFYSNLSGGFPEIPQIKKKLE